MLLTNVAEDMLGRPLLPASRGRAKVETLGPERRFRTGSGSLPVFACRCRTV